MLLAGWAAARGGLAQNSKPAPNQQQAAGSDTTFKIKAERNLVPVRVVVRDSKGNAVSGLQKEDFRVFDNKKPQTITEFSVESAGAKATPKTAAPAGQPTIKTKVAAVPRATSTPERFVALYFDDIHLSFEDAVCTRDAAKKYLDTIGPADRAAVFTSSSRLKQEFTSDRAKLAQTLDRLQPQPRTATIGRECPDISPFQAWQIAEHQRADAIQLAVLDLIACRCNGDARMCGNARMEVEGDALQVLAANEMETRETLRELASLVQHMAAMPGQRNIVFVSPGFLSENLKSELSQIADRALRARVVINTFDSRGLWVYTPGGDASTPSGGISSPQYVTLKSSLDQASLQTSADVLADLAAETGGVFFENSNDYDAGFRRTGGLPEASYVLAFSPEKLKPNGSFHTLKVTLVNGAGLTVQARRGYFAPRKEKEVDTTIQAHINLVDAVFSRDEIRELPFDVQTGVSKTDANNAELSVVAHVDMSSARFRKANGRNLDNVTLVAALFDSDGNYVTGTQTELEMRLKDSSLDRVTHDGVSVKTSLSAQAGNYSIRIVVRDSETTRMSALNRTIEIPD